MNDDWSLIPYFTFTEMVELLEEAPRVLIGSPTYEGKEYCRRAFVKNVRSFTYLNKTFVMVDNSKGTSYSAKLRRDGVPVARVYRGRNSRDALANASNFLRQRVLDGGYDWLLMLESDIFPPPDIIERLLQHADTTPFDLRNGRRVIGAPYNIGFENDRGLCIFITRKDEELGTLGTRRILRSEEAAFLNGQLRQVHGMGVGCVLIHKTVLERFKFWYSELDDDRMNGLPIRKHPDVYFYLDLHNHRVPVFCDTSAVIDHQPSKWSLVNDV